MVEKWLVTWNKKARLFCQNCKRKINISYTRKSFIPWRKKVIFYVSTYFLSKYESSFWVYTNFLSFCNAKVGNAFLSKIGKRIHMGAVFQPLYQAILHSSYGKFILCFVPQCGNFRIFTLFTFYVKSILENLEVVKLPFLPILGIWNFLNLVHFIPKKSKN